MYYLQSRYYDPELGRFINADAFVSTGQGLLGNNMFAYCGNNPIIYSDPTGTLNIREGTGGSLIASGNGGGSGNGNSGHYQVVWPKNWPNLGTTSAAVAAVVTISFATADQREEQFALQVWKKEIAATTTPQKLHDHHIVAKSDWRAEESRQILMDVGIDPKTDPRNRILIPANYHTSLHTTAYHLYVTTRLRLVAGNSIGVEVTLAMLKVEILVYSSIGIRWI